LRQRLQRTSRAPDLQTSMPPPRPYTRSTPPELRISLHRCTSRTPEFHTSMSLRLRRISRPLLTQRPYTCNTPPELHASMSLRLQRTSRAPELLRQTPPRLHACSAHPELQSSRALCLLHVPTRATHLQSSGALETKRQRRRRTPELQISCGKHLRVCTSAAHLQTSFEATSPGLRHAS